MHDSLQAIVKESSNDFLKNIFEVSAVPLETQQYNTMQHNAT